MIWKVITEDEWDIMASNMYTSRTAAVAEYTAPWDDEPYGTTRTLEMWVETTSGKLVRCVSWTRNIDDEISIAEMIADHKDRVEDEANRQSWFALDMEAALRGERLRY